MPRTQHEVTSDKVSIVQLDCCEAFNHVTPTEKLYAHYMNKASWYGGLISFIQTSPETPLIFSLLHRIFLSETIDELHESILRNGLLESEFDAFLLYACAFFAYSGNYYGSTKMIPEIAESTFESIVFSSMAYKIYPETITVLWERCEKPIYLLNERTGSIGLLPKGVTTYFSGNCTIEDADFVTEWLKFKQMHGFICRTFKSIDNGVATYDIKLASVQTEHLEGITLAPELYKGCWFKITRGDYSKLLSIVNENLHAAKKFAGNRNRMAMLDHYINSFNDGSLEQHIEGSRCWIKDKQPAVESYIGFIETYRDPAGIRGEFEGFVAIVNKEVSEKLEVLTSNEEHFIELLPWDKYFEKDNYLKPNFTALDVLAYSGSDIAVGINLPNYEEIRQNEGTKNVLLTNVIRVSKQKVVYQFLLDEDLSLLKQYKDAATEVQIGLHELLGHGSGKLFRLEADGSFNFERSKVINPLTGRPIERWYNPGETFESKFGKLHSSYEECRADAIGMYLSLNPKVLHVFRHYDAKEISNIIYVNWLKLLCDVINFSILHYSTRLKEWTDAHGQARFVLLKLLVEAGQGFVSVEETEQGANLILKIDRTKMYTVGKEALKIFLIKLQVFKSTGDVDSAKQMYNYYSEVNNRGSYPWAKWRNIIVDNINYDNSGIILVQSNTEICGKTVRLNTYEPNYRGLIKSWMERFPCVSIDNILQEIWEEDKIFFPDLVD